MCFCEDVYSPNRLGDQITRVLILRCLFFFYLHFQSGLLICELKVCRRMAVCRSLRAALADSLCRGMKSM